MCPRGGPPVFASTGPYAKNKEKLSENKRRNSVTAIFNRRGFFLEEKALRVTRKAPQVAGTLMRKSKSKEWT